MSDDSVEDFYNEIDRIETAPIKTKDTGLPDSLTNGFNHILIAVKQQIGSLTQNNLKSHCDFFQRHIWTIGYM